MSKQRQKGTRGENEIVDFLRRAGFPNVERKALHGTRDEGDLTGIPSWAISVKNCREHRLGEWLDELRVQMIHAKALFGVVIFKRRGKSAAGAFALVPMEVLIKLLPRLEK